jgi:hypothetical protein
MESIGQGIDLLAQWPLLCLAVSVSALCAAIKMAGQLDKTNSGRWILPLLPLVLGAVGGLLLKAEAFGIAGSIVVGMAVGAVSGQVYEAVKRIVVPKPDVQVSVDK